MKFGIPFIRSFGRPFGVPFLDISGGGGLQPSGALLLIEAYDSANFSLVTGDSISQADDLSGQANHLTQPTSGNQLKLVEANTLTQFIGANQPTYTQVSGEDVMAFGGNDVLDGEIIQDSGQHSIEFVTTVGDATRTIFMRDSIAGNDNFEVRTLNNARFNFDVSSVVVINFLQTLSLNTKYKFFFTIDTDALELKLYIDDVLQGTGAIIAGRTWNNPNRIGHISLALFNLTSFRSWNVIVADPTNPTETPFKTITADPSKMRTSANVVPVLNDTVAKVYAEEHSGYRDNEILGDGTDDFMLGIPPQAGDFTYPFKKEAKTLGTVKKLFSSSTTSAEVRINVSNQIEVVSDAGTVFTYATSIVLAEQQVNLLRLEGTSLALYETQTALETKDVTGETFTLDYWCAGTNSSDSGWKYIGLYPLALDQSGIDYFYYERNIDTGEIEQPPQLPETSTAVSSVKYSGLGTDYHVATNDIFAGSSAFTIYGWVIPTGSTSETILAESISTDGGSKINFRIGWISSAHYLQIRPRYTNNNNVFITSTATLNPDVPNFVSCTFVRNGDIVLGVNGVYETSAALDADINNTVGVVPPSVGQFRYLTDFSTPMSGGASFIGADGTVALSQSELEEIRNGSQAYTAISKDQYSAPLQTKLVNSVLWNLGTYPSSPSQIEDQFGSNDLTEVGTISNVDQGLKLK